MSKRRKFSNEFKHEVVALTRQPICRNQTRHSASRQAVARTTRPNSLD